MNTFSPYDKHAAPIIDIRKQTIFNNFAENFINMMTKSQLQMSYIIAQMYYQKKLTVKETRALAMREGISENSQSNYFCPAYRHLVNGTSFNGNLSSYVWKYYLSRIFSEFNDNVNQNALKCFLHAIGYSEAKSNSNAVTLREIYSRYSSILRTSLHNQKQD